jgi:hydroxyacylglutathione hydrolase
VKSLETPEREHHMPLSIAIIPVTPFEQNCTLLFDSETKVGAIVDPGGDVDSILAGIKETGAKIERIVITHGHVDHVGGAMELKEKLGGVEIVGPHKADQQLMDNTEASARKYGLTGLRNCTPDRYLEEGGTIEMAGLTFEILHCPGHSPGSLVYVQKNIGLALVGDVLFRGSIGRTDFPLCDHEALIHSIKTKLFPLGDEMVFLCGHGPAGRIGEERMTNPFVGEGAMNDN